MAEKATVSLLSLLTYIHVGNCSCIFSTSAIRGGRAGSTGLFESSMTPRHLFILNIVFAGARKRWSEFKALFTAALLISASFSVAAAQSYSALYEVEADGMSLGKLERNLSQGADGSYILKTKTYTTGFWAIFIKDRVNEESRFAMVDGKVIPKSYHYAKKKKGKLIEERVTFDSVKGTIISSSGSGKQSFTLTGGESDKLLYQFRIREVLRRGESELQFAVVDRMRLRLYEFKVGKLELLDTPMGKMEAVRVDRVNEKKRKTTLWFAPGLDYLPIKIVQDTGDHNFSSTIISTSIQRQK